jgi:uncharacterized protein (DUF427 family)
VNKKKIEIGDEQESAWDYPRPPKIEPVKQAIKIEFNGVVIADSSNAKRVLERGHPPVYYLPLEDINSLVLLDSTRKTWCEWKGEASYYDVVVGDKVSKNAAWFYPNPSPDFLDIKDNVAFYAGKMEACYVGEELVIPQAGDFYGGWITTNIQGPFKGSSRIRTR